MSEDAPLATRRVAEIDTSATRRVEATDLPTSRTELAAAALLPVGVLQPGAVLCGDCVVEQTLYAHESQRPGLYLCRAPEGQVIVKIAALNFPPRPELWQRLQFLNHPNILRTFRTIEENGYFYEVQEYCPGGTLAALVPTPDSGVKAVSGEWIEKVLVAHIHEALKYLHSQEIIHRDIKPANIYVKQVDGQDVLVLADFDISAVLEQTRTSRDTHRAAGTWLYTAPEAFPRFVDDHASSRRGRITRSSDYYSLGITIIELLLGTTSLHQTQLPDLFDFYLQGGRVEIPAGVPGRVAMLLRGLLIRSRHTRWGPAEVERWLRGQTSQDDMKRIQDDEYFELARASRPYRLRDRYAVDLPGLAEAMFREPDVATEDLITGDILLNWIGGLDPGVAREIRRDRDRLFLFPELVLHSAIMRCDPTRPFVFEDGSEAFTGEEWFAFALQLVQQTKAPPETVVTGDMLLQLEAWLRLKIDPEPALAEAIAQIREAPPKIQLEEIAYLLQPERPFFVTRGVSAATPKELAAIAYGKAEEWKSKRPAIYDAVYQRWHEGALCAWLRQRGLAELASQIDEVRERLADEPYAAFETILRLLDPELPRVRLELNAVEIAHGCTVMYGRSRTFTVRYKARGAGTPFGAFLLYGAQPGVQLNNHIVRQREGTVEIAVDPRHIPSGKAFTARLEFESTIAQAANLPLRFTFTIVFPLDITVRLMLAGAGIGAVLLAIPRLILALITEGGLVSPADFSLGTLWDEIAGWQYPSLPYIIAFLVMLACLYAGLRIWLWALRRSKV